MNEFNSNDINDAKRRVEEMRKKANNYVDSKPCSDNNNNQDKTEKENKNEVVSAAQAIAQGISKDGGLFVPQEFPTYDDATFNELLKLDYKGRAKKILPYKC